MANYFDRLETMDQKVSRIANEIQRRCPSMDRHQAEATARQYIRMALSMSALADSYRKMSEAALGAVKAWGDLVAKYSRPSS